MPVSLSLIWPEPQRWAVPAVLLLSAVGTPLVLWWERRRPSSFPGSAAHRAALAEAGVASLDEWRRLSAVEQEAADTASLDRGEQAVLDAEESERERKAAVEEVVRRARVNSLFRP